MKFKPGDKVQIIYRGTFTWSGTVVSAHANGYMVDAEPANELEQKTRMFCIESQLEAL
jgi:hypothetical protein